MSDQERFPAENFKLRQEWHQSYAPCDDFIYDGPTDPDRWFIGKERILCILKEAHGGGVWNHADEIRDCGGLLRVGWPANQATHNRMVEWLYATECSLNEKHMNVEAERSSDYPEARAIMLRSAWINIKKANGVSHSDASNLRSIADRDMRFLNRQIALLSPRIVLCCGTFDLVGDLLFPDRQMIAGTTCSYQSGSLVIIKYRHPLYAPRESYGDFFAEMERIKIAGVLSKQQP